MQMADGGGGGTASIGAATSSIFDSMATFAKTAATGGFEVSAEGGKALIQAITNFQEWAAANIAELDKLSQERMLGQSNGAQVMAPFAQTIASDEQGFATQLKALRDSLEQAKEGIQKAMDNYQATEQANRAKSNAVQV